MRVLAGLTLVVLLCTCSSKIQRSLLTANQIKYRSEMTASTNMSCREAEAYAPDTANPSHQYVQQIRVNFHIMDSALGVYNYDHEEGRAFVHAVLDECNRRLMHNMKMHLPPGNDTPVLPANYQMVLAPDPEIPGDDGIYFQQDPDLYYYILGRNSNRTSREVIQKYAIQPESVVNVFLQPHHPDSVGRPDYRAVGTGIMLGSSIKIAQIFADDPPPLSCVGLLNHEMGHVFGLSHTWRGNDGCDDTPKHDNCWSYTDTPPCDSMVSNNLMDYNKWQWALTPCQIGRVHRHIANPDSRARKYVNHIWCDYDSLNRVLVTDSVVWSGAKDLSSDLVLKAGATLEIQCRVSLPKGARITVSPGARLIINHGELHNACGDQWYGIEILSTRKDSGIVEFAGNPKLSDMMHPIAGMSIR